MKDHRLIDERSLAVDRLIAAKLSLDPALLDKVRLNLSRWLQTSDNRSVPALLEWQRVLDGPLAEILALLRVHRRTRHPLAPIKPVLRHPDPGRASRHYPGISPA